MTEREIKNLALLRVTLARIDAAARGEKTSLSGAMCLKLNFSRTGNLENWECEWTAHPDSVAEVRAALGITEEVAP